MLANFDKMKNQKQEDIEEESDEGMDAEIDEIEDHKIEDQWIAFIFGIIWIWIGHSPFLPASNSFLSFVNFLKSSV